LWENADRKLTDLNWLESLRLTLRVKNKPVRSATNTAQIKIGNGNIGGCGFI
jgi:hypothetical protein